MLRAVDCDDEFSKLAPMFGWQWFYTMYSFVCVWCSSHLLSWLYNLRIITPTGLNMAGLVCGWCQRLVPFPLLVSMSKLCEQVEVGPWEACIFCNHSIMTFILIWPFSSEDKPWSLYTGTWLCSQLIALSFSLWCMCILFLYYMKPLWVRWLPS